MDQDLERQREHYKRCAGTYDEFFARANPNQYYKIEEIGRYLFVSGSMHHFADPAKAIVELCRHLRPGGRLAICEPIVYNPINLVKAAREREEWGQFRVQRGWVRQRLLEEGGRLLADRVLHWKGSNPVLQRLWPYRRLERFSLLSPLAVMFLLVMEK